jgi:hypothetical protein
VLGIALHSETMGMCIFGDRRIAGLGVEGLLDGLFHSLIFGCFESLLRCVFLLLAFWDTWMRDVYDETAFFCWFGL